jgi:hypothetical protein
MGGFKRNVLWVLKPITLYNVSFEKNFYGPFKKSWRAEKSILAAPELEGLIPNLSEFQSFSC